MPPILAEPLLDFVAAELKAEHEVAQEAAEVEVTPGEESGLLHANLREQVMDLSLENARPMDTGSGQVGESSGGSQPSVVVVRTVVREPGYNVMNVHPTFDGFSPSAPKPGAGGEETKGTPPLLLIQTSP